MVRTVIAAVLLVGLTSSGPAWAQGSAESAWKSDAYDRDDGACGVLFSLPCSALLPAPRPDTDDPESSIRT